MFWKKSDKLKNKQQSHRSQEHQLRWSPRLKHPQLLIYGNRIRRTPDLRPQMFAYCVLIDKPLFKSEDVISWTIKCSQACGSLILGICLTSRPARNEFGFGEMDGHYIIDNMGALYSDTYPHQNNQADFQFGPFDTIKLTLDQKLMFLKVQKVHWLWLRRKQYIFKDISRPPAGDDYRPCFYIMHGDELELI